jgi:hypothetical protein
MQAIDIRTLAETAGEYFTLRRRGDETFTTLRDDAPDWVRDIVYRAHGGMLPDSWRYDRIRDAFRAIADGLEDASEFAADAVDVYADERLRWLASNLNRPAYCDEAGREFGSPGDILELIGFGQYLEAAEVFGLVLDGLLSSSA